MIDFKSSETAKNLIRAFAGESQARNRYTLAAGTFIGGRPRGGGRQRSRDCR